MKTKGIGCRYHVIIQQKIFDNHTYLIAVCWLKIVAVGSGTRPFGGIGIADKHVGIPFCLTAQCGCV